MILGAVKRVLLTELYARAILALLLAALGTIGPIVPEHPPLSGCLIGLTLMVIVYRVRYGRW